MIQYSPYPRCVLYCLRIYPVPNTCYLPYGYLSLSSFFHTTHRHEGLFADYIAIPNGNSFLDLNLMMYNAVTTQVHLALSQLDKETGKILGQGRSLVSYSNFLPPVSYNFGRYLRFFGQSFWVFNESIILAQFTHE